ncbi:hypothetical protein ACIF6L_34845 [Kitasatospora sp. NPDC086009]|uniref:hypothetical protein n=1 Tax=unclassified Kitasatospora TaxID=2633591 RepID=UPI0037C6F188
MSIHTPLPTEQRDRYRRLLTSPWLRWTRTARTARELLAAADQHAAQHAEEHALGTLPQTLFAVEPDTLRTVANATGAILGAVAAGRLPSPLSVSAGTLAVRIAVRPETIQQWELWRAAVGARPGSTIHKGGYSVAKGVSFGAPIVLVGYGVGALYMADLRASQ